MEKVQFGPQTSIYPMPAFLIGANVDGKPNVMTAAWSSNVNSEPPMISVGVRYNRHTYKGIKQNATFSVNVPSIDQIKETDYCGIVSGEKEDKIAVCGFDVFYGKLGTAPMIAQCPVNLECTVLHEIHLGSHALFIGRIEEVHASKDCLTDGKIDVMKIKPVVYSSGVQKAYHTTGESVGHAFQIGLELKK